MRGGFAVHMQMCSFPLVFLYPYYNNISLDTEKIIPYINLNDVVVSSNITQIHYLALSS